MESTHRTPLTIAALRARNAMILLISWTAGSVDAISYYGLGHVFTANMTGNSVLLAIALGGQASGLIIERNIVALAAFLLGTAFGGYIILLKPERSTPAEREWPLEVTIALSAETALLVLFSVVWELLYFGSRTSFVSSSALAASSTYLLIAICAVAMGIQSVAISHLGVWGVVTTYITGTYLGLITGVVKRVGGRNPKSERSRKMTESQTGQELENRPAEQRHSLKLQGLVLLVYGVGAATSGAVFADANWLVPMLPLVSAVIVIVLGEGFA
jgi:uncharacterized membrane protein YoaK (UPF0700 family)